jgi:hypothetical protein
VNNLKIFGDGFELIDYCPLLSVDRADGRLQAVIKVIVNKNGFRTFERPNDSMHLLGNFSAVAVLFNHDDDGFKMPLCALQAIGNRAVSFMRMLVVGCGDWLTGAGCKAHKC